MGFRRYFAFLLALVCVFAVSCAPSHNVQNSEGTTGENESIPHKITPAHYAEGDIIYALTISDGRRSVTLDVSRASGITEAKVTSPEGMLGVSIVCDAGGTRITPPNGELLGLTEDGAAGLRTFFDAMAHEVSEGEKTAEGMYTFELSGYEVTLLLSLEGYPKLISLSRDGYTRHGEVAFPEK